MKPETRAQLRYHLATLMVASLSIASLVANAGSPSMPPTFPTPFKVIAHRGASAYAPENTVAAYARAKDLGVVDVELDVQLSKDDIVILFHDSSLLEKTGYEGSVRDYRADELLKMDIGSWFDRTHPDLDERFAGTRLDTLDELFETFGDVFRYHVELKSAEPELARLTLERIKAHGLESSVRFTSFMFDQVKRAHELAPHIPADLLVRDATRLRQEAQTSTDAPVLPLQKAEVDRAAEAGFDLVGFASEDFSAELVKYAIGRGLEIRAWRIKSDEDMKRAIELGADGMTTNWPDRLIRELLLHKRSIAPR